MFSVDCKRVYKYIRVLKRVIEIHNTIGDVRYLYSRRIAGNMAQTALAGLSYHTSPLSAEITYRMMILKMALLQPFLEQRHLAHTKGQNQKVPVLVIVDACVFFHFVYNIRHGSKAIGERIVTDR